MTDEEKKELFIQETVKALMLSELHEQLLRAILDIEERPIYYIPQRRVLKSFQTDTPMHKRIVWHTFAEKTKGVMK